MHDWISLLLTFMTVGGGALVPLEEEKSLGPPAVNKVDLLTDGLNDREANWARSGTGSIALSKEGGRQKER